MEYNNTRAIQKALGRIADALKEQNELLAKIVEKIEEEDKNND